MTDQEITEKKPSENEASDSPEVDEQNRDGRYIPRKVESNDRRRFVLSLIIVLTWCVAALAWLYVSYLGPVYSPDGERILNDRPGNFAIAMGVIGAVTSAVVGFWFGAAGKSSAEKAATQAGQRADLAEAKAEGETASAKEADERAKRAQVAVRALEPLVEPTKKDLLADVKRLYPEAFAQNGGS